MSLRGEKLRGEWLLVRDPKDERTRTATRTRRLVKTGESMRAVSRKADDTSALTGRSMAAIAADASAAWHSHRTA